MLMILQLAPTRLGNKQIQWFDDGDQSLNQICAAEIAIPTAQGMLLWSPDLAYPCVLEQPAKDEFEVVG
jgi:hypothetical protein